MNLIEVYHGLEEIAACSSRNRKEEILQKHLEVETFRKVVVHALDPYRRYGVVPPLDQPGTGTETRVASDVFGLLDRLANRTLTGNAAATALSDMYSRVAPEIGIVLSRILRKDLRCGVTAKTVNKIRPGLIGTFSVMLVHKFDPKKVRSWPVAVQPKLDGFRMIAEVDYDAGTVRFLSRTGKEDFAQMPKLEEALLAQPHLQEHGLVYIDGEAMAGDFNETSSALRRKNSVCEDVTFHVFDMLVGREWKDGCPYGFQYRHTRLGYYLVRTDHLIPLNLLHAHDERDVQAHYEQARRLGFEGIIVKDPHGLYEKKRSHAWMKIKAQESLDLRVVDIFEGEGKYAGSLGGVIVDLNGTQVRVGGGFTDLERQEFWQFPDRIIGRLIEVEYHEQTKDGSLRHPRFLRCRDDKDDRDAA